MRLHQLTESNQSVTEAAEDRTSYQVAKILFDKGIRYDSSSKEGELINAIGLVMVKELNMDPRIVKNIISRDDDFLADTLDELYHMSQSVKEDFNGEYDDEAGMVQSNLRTMARAVNGLLDTIEDNDNLPEWAQEKIAKAEMMTTSVWDYLLSQKEQGMDPKVTEASQRVDSLVTDALKIMRGSTMNDAVQALKTVLGDREYNDRRGHYNFYVRQILDMYGQQGNLKEFAPGNGGGESGRWYTDDQMTDIVGDGWWQDLDISGDIPKQQMIQEAQAWLNDQGYSVQVLNCKVNDDDMEWYIEGSFQNSRFAKKGIAEAKADPTGSWVVYKGSKVTKFKTHTGAKAYAEKNGGKVASSEYYHDKIQKQGGAND